MNKISNIILATAIATSFIGTANATSVIAGYLDATATGSALKVNMSQASKDGYNMSIIGFAKVSGTSITWLTPETKTIADNQAASSKKEGMQTLLSIGGQANTWEPGSLSDNDINTLAKNIVSFVRDNGFDGVDFDLEVKVNPDLLKKLLTEIKALNPSVLITAAPQINNNRIVTTGNNEDYKEAIDAGLFNYLFMQEYNTGPQNTPDFISSSFPELANQIPSNVNTKIIIGEPTAAVGAGKTSIYYPDSGQILTTQEVTALMLPQLKIINTSTKYGGVMGWSLNVDYDAVDYNDPNHISGTYAYGLKECVIFGQCTTPPPPKKPLPNYTLQTNNTGKSGIILNLKTPDGSVFESDYIAPGAFKLYSKTTTPVNVASLEDKTDISVQWKTYDGGPSGTCQGTFDLTHNENIFVNPDNGACTFNTVP